MADDTTPHIQRPPETEPHAVMATQAEQAIVDAGGNPDLLLPHLTGQLGWRKEGDAVTIFSGEKEGAEACRDLVAQLKSDPRYAAAFHPQPKAEANPAPQAGFAQPDHSTSGLKSGSGAMPSAGFSSKAITSTDPLAIGQALHDIAHGSVTVNFNG